MTQTGGAAGPRIVSLVPSLTELVCALGLGGQLVGRTGFCIHPGEQVRQVPRIGGTKQADVAKIRALAPSHLIVNREENPKPLVDQLAEFIPHIVVTHAITVADNVRLYRQFGEIFDTVVAAEQLVDAFEHARARLLSRQFEPLQVLYLIWRKPWMTVASDTFISHMLAQANLITVPATDVDHAADAQRYPVLDDTQLAGAGAAVVLMSSEPYRFRESHGEIIRSLPGMTNTRCRLIDGEMTSWYGPRVIKGLAYLGRFREELETERRDGN